MDLLLSNTFCPRYMFLLLHLRSELVLLTTCLPFTGLLANVFFGVDSVDLLGSSCLSSATAACRICCCLASLLASTYRLLLPNLVVINCRCRACQRLVAVQIELLRNGSLQQAGGFFLGLVFHDESVDLVLLEVPRLSVFVEHVVVVVEAVRSCRPADESACRHDLVQLGLKQVLHAILPAQTVVELPSCLPTMFGPARSTRALPCTRFESSTTSEALKSRRTRRDCVCKHAID